MKASECFTWTKKIDALHLYKSGEITTICGKPMLGNNYSPYVFFSERTKCEKCFAEVEDDIS